MRKDRWIMADQIPFVDKLRMILKERDISTHRFQRETLIDRKIFYNKDRQLHKSTLMGIAYYLKMDAEEMVEGTDAENVWYS